jgi:hypothetical protein
VNLQSPGAAYTRPEHTFRAQAAAVSSLESVLADFDIAPLHLLSGRGHHFVWSVSRDSPAFTRLAQLGHLPDHLRERYGQPHSPRNERIDPQLGLAFSGLGLVMEYLAHRVKLGTRLDSPLPVELAADSDASTAGPVELVSIDMTEYGDPLHTRKIRIPFSAYLKPRTRYSLPQDQQEGTIPWMFLIPANHLSIEEAIATLRDASRAAHLATRITARIPNRSGPTERLVEAYSRSSLARHHGWFYSQEHQPPERWPATYDISPLKELPACARHVLENPNDLLLKPSSIRLVVCSFLSLGWHPRHIAGLIRSKFERDRGWGRQWLTYDAATRADFYVRIFSGLVAQGTDDLTGLACRPGRPGPLCRDAGGMCHLHEHARSILHRRQYERLACRPFNGLFLPEEHL